MVASMVVQFDDGFASRFVGCFDLWMFKFSGRLKVVDAQQLLHQWVVAQHELLLVVAYGFYLCGEGWEVEDDGVAACDWSDFVS